MVLLRSGKKTRIDAPKVTSDKRDQTLLDFNSAASDEEQQTPTVEPKPRRTPKSTGKKLSHQADEKAKVETPGRTPRKAATTKRSESTKQVSARKTKAAEASSSKAGSSSGSAGPSKSVFLKSGAGEIRRKRLSEEKNRARKLSEGRDTSCSRVTAKVQTVQENVENAEDEDSFAIDFDSVIAGPIAQVSLYRLLNLKPAEETTDFYNAGDEAAILNSKKNRNNRIKMQFHQIAWSDDENEEWSDSESDFGSSYDIGDEIAGSDEIEFGCSPSAADSSVYKYEDVLASQVNGEEKLIDTGAFSSRVSVWWEPDDELKGGVEVIDGTSSSHAYSREANEGSGVSPSSVSSSASANSWHTAMGSASISTAFHSTNRRYAEERDEKLLRW